MKLSARNVLKGTVVEISIGAVTSHIRLDVAGNIVTSSIINETVDD
jgi:molybdopterin-binding protein